MARRPPRTTRPAGRAAHPAAPTRPGPRKKAAAGRTAAARPAGGGAKASRKPAAASKTAAARQASGGARASKKPAVASRARAKAPAPQPAPRKPAATGAAHGTRGGQPATTAPQTLARKPAPRTSRALPAGRSPKPQSAKAPPAPSAIRATARRLRPARTRPAPASYVDLEPEDDNAGEVIVPGAVSSLDMDHQPREVRRTGVDPESPLLTRHLEDARLVAGDVDADVQAASQVGEETPGGDNPTPDQDVVDLIGRSLGVEYEDDEELEGGEEIVRRDRKRWELDPASSEDWKERGKG